MSHDLSSRLQRLSPLWVAVAIGTLLSLWSMARNPVLNDDAYLYLRAAQVFMRDGAAAMYAEYGWAHYSVLIAFFDQLLPGDLLAGARALNLLLQGLLMGVFVTLSQRLYPGRRHAALAALTLLFYPQLNELRFAVIRDFGFWAFALWSLLLLLQYRDSHRLRHGLGWVATLTLACAFRLEALLLAVVTPLALMNREHRRQGLQLYAMLLSLGVACLAVCALLGVDLFGLMRFAWRYYLPQMTLLPQEIGDTAASLMHLLFTDSNLPGSDSTGHGIVILLLAYAYSLVAVVVQALSVPLTLLLLHAAWRRWWTPAVSWRNPHALYLACTAASLLVFLALMHFLTERYTMLLCLLLLLQVPAVLNRWIEHARSLTGNLRYRLLAAFFMVYYAADSLLSFGAGHNQLLAARDWLALHAGTGSALLTNNAYLAFQSGRVDHFDTVRKTLPELLARARDGDLLAIAVNARELAERHLLEQDQRLQMLESFHNGRGDEVRFYQVH